MSDFADFVPGQEALVVLLVYDDGEQKSYEMAKDVVCLTVEDAHSFVAERYPEANRHGDAYQLVVNGDVLDVFVVFWRVPLWPARIAATKGSD